MSEERIPTTERLALALEAAGAPQEMIANARGGRYDDFKCEVSATPCIDLVRDCATHGLWGLRTRAMDGEFDSQKWESDAWAKANEDDPELGPALAMINKMAGKKPGGMS